MQFYLSEAIASYKPLSYEKLKKIVEDSLSLNQGRKNICLWCVAMVILFTASLIYYTYQYFYNDGAALHVVLCFAILLIATYVLSFFWGLAEKTLIMSYRQDFPYMDKAVVSSCLSNEDFDKLINEEVTASQYEKLDYLSSKNLLFKNKYSDIMKLRSGKFTQFDYKFMNIEKIYAVFINSEK